MHYFLSHSFKFLALGCVFASLPLKADVIPLSSQQSLNVAIYNGNVALVDDARQVALKKGPNTLLFEDIAEQIIAESALLKGFNIQTIEQNFNYDLINRHSLLEKSVGKEIIVETTNPATGDKTQTPAKLLAFNDNQPVVLMNGKIVSNPAGEILLNNMPEGLIARPSLNMLVNSGDASTQTLHLNYLTNGLSWEANYVAALNEDETSMSLNGFITLNNLSASAFLNAQLQLVAGDVSIVRPRMRYATKGAMRLEGAVAMNAMADAMPAVENVSDFYVYTLPFKTSIAPRQTKQVALLSKGAVPVIKEYVFDNTLKSYGHPLENIKPYVTYNIDNNESSDLGIALPKGVIRFYKNTQGEKALFVGETSLPHTPKKAHIRLRLGEAFDVFANAKRTSFIQLGKNANRSSYEIKVTNSSQSEKTVTIYENFGGNWEIVKSSHDYIKETSNRVRFKIVLPPEGEETITYTVHITDNERGGR